MTPKEDKNSFFFWEGVQQICHLRPPTQSAKIPAQKCVSYTWVHYMSAYIVPRWCRLFSSPVSWQAPALARRAPQLGSTVLPGWPVTVPTTWERGARRENQRATAATTIHPRHLCHILKCVTHLKWFTAASNHAFLAYFWEMRLI